MHSLPSHPCDDDVARAFLELHRVLDRIRRGEVQADDRERRRIADALDALRELRAA
jgi:hypothetical protein